MNGRKVLLMVDNFSAYPKVVEGLTNVELFFLPSNTTSKIQPCDVGIIRALKIHYRYRFYSSILEDCEIRSNENIAYEPQVGKDEDINGLRDAISGLH
ncbi:hypothetical protein QYF36_016628 [Acer negundo]|nr:hypothetical protein QYF36_016628 [Acer negundo]